MDLQLFKAGEPSLYEEFRSDYEQMGSKSFDHSKKFWFNKLRRLYHLKEQPKPIAIKEPINEEPAIPETDLASQATELDSPTIEQTSGPLPQTEFKPAFKPRFKAGLTKPAEPSPPAKPPPPEPPLENVFKPAFKPRFKAGITKPSQPPPPESPEV